MSGKGTMERIKQNAQLAKQTIEELKNELNIINNEYNTLLSRQLQEENAKLLAAVEDAKKKLIKLEVQNGVKQVPVPNQTVNVSAVEAPQADINKDEPKAPAEAPKPKKEKKAPKEQKVAEELPIDVGRLDLRIGKIEDIKRHRDADTLYVLQINVGEEKPRTVCSGLVKHIPMEELRDKTVVALCNLKPVKMRGITSEAMVMCASSEAGVETLIPPANSGPGDLVTCEGYTRQPDSVMNPKKKIFETVAPDLHTNDNLEACYKNIPFKVEGKGVCYSKTLKNVPVK
ncbi:aminoacyl tRNA synthase complex-interacting multifunctional protein 1 isoform X2 [Diabrotica virgifera virgifera]|nr:aminoacyl tRNA synthase complex-interacting multifunctional protein 1 isoform X2 [Diabrotica virgifera virgifera]